MRTRRQKYTWNFGGETWKTKEMEGLRWFLGKYVMWTACEGIWLSTVEPLESRDVAD
jgi:hypothetical protein